jgi:hypothetical protein
MKRLAVVLVLIVVSFETHLVYGVSFRKGDIFVNKLSGLQQYRPNGMLIQSFFPEGFRTFEGATITSRGKLVTTHRGPTPGINIFDADGNEVSFATPDVSLPGDVSVFADGTLAVNDQGDGVKLYSQTGNFLGAISHSSLDAGVSSPFGSVIGPDDTLWVALFSYGTARFSRSGEFLGSFDPPFEVQDLAVDPVDGTHWIPSPTGRLHHFTQGGVELSSFMTAATPPFLRGVAVAADQSIYVTSQNSSSVYHYSPSGTLLDSFNVGMGTIFMSVATVPEPSAFAQLGAMLLLLMSAHWRGRYCR